MKRFISVLVVAASLGSSPLPATESAPVVAAPAGKLRGAAVGDIHVFKGIPYALPPTGPMRWKPPQCGSAELEGHARRDAVRLRVRAAQAAAGQHLLLGPAADERGLPVAQHLGAGRRAQGAGVLLDPRRRALGRRGQRCVVRRRQARGARHRGRLHQLSPGRARLSRASAVERGVAQPRLRQLRAARPDRGAALGQSQHRRVRRRSRECHDRGRVGGRAERDVSHGGARGARLVRQGHRAERVHGVCAGAAHHTRSAAWRRSRRACRLPRRQARPISPRCVRWMPRH